MFVLISFKTTLRDRESLAFLAVEWTISQHQLCQPLLVPTNLLLRFVSVLLPTARRTVTMRRKRSGTTAPSRSWRSSWRAWTESTGRWTSTPRWWRWRRRCKLTWPSRRSWPTRPGGTPRPTSPLSTVPVWSSATIAICHCNCRLALFFCRALRELTLPPSLAADSTAAVDSEKPVQPFLPASHSLWQTGTCFPSCFFFLARQQLEDFWISVAAVGLLLYRAVSCARHLYVGLIVWIGFVERCRDSFVHKQSLLLYVLLIQEKWTLQYPLSFDFVRNLVCGWCSLTVQDGSGLNWWMQQWSFDTHMSRLT